MALQRLHVRHWALTGVSRQPGRMVRVALCASHRFISQAVTWQACVRRASAERARAHGTLSPSTTGTLVAASSPSPLSSTAALQRPRILVSACLLGHVVAYHGKPPRGRRANAQQQKCDDCPHGRAAGRCAASPLPVLQHILCDVGGFVELVPLCPEVQLLGLPVPRKPIHLARAADGQIAVRESGASGRTLLELSNASTLHSCFPARCDSGEVSAPHLPAIDGDEVASVLRTVDAVILKSRSPSCGVGDARHYTARHGAANREAWEPGDGFFTELLRRSLATTTAAHAPPVVITTERQLRLLDSDNAEEVELVTRNVRQHDASFKGVRPSPENTLMKFLECAFAHCAARHKLASELR